MSKQSMMALRQAMGGPPGQHLERQRLAEVAAAEAAGEPVEEIYPAALAHLEECLACAEVYSQLVMMALNSAETMAAAADAVPPEAVYAAFLRQAAPEMPPHILESVVARLPLHFTAAPLSPDDVRQQVVEPATAGTWTTRLLQAIRQELPALRLYLEEAAAAVWQRVEGLQVDVNGRRLPIGTTLVFSLREENTAYAVGEWVAVELARLSPLAGRLTVRLHPADDDPVAGRSISIQIEQDTLTAITDEQGIAHFEPVPLAALPYLTIEVQPAGGNPPK